MPSFKLKEDPDCPSSTPPAPPAAVEAAEGAYPNPFNSSVSLRYHLNEPGRVEVAIYSITGQFVRRLLSEKDAKPGFYSVTWDGISDGGAQVASGMYLVRVQSPSLVKSFKPSPTYGTGGLFSYFHCTGHPREELSDGTYQRPYLGRTPRRSGLAL